MIYYIPTTLDIDALLVSHPSNIPSFKKKHLLYIITLITSIPANSRSLTARDGYVSINAQLLQKVVRNYKAYIDYLIEAGVLETDNRYIRGSKSKGYRFANKYSGIVRVYDAESKSHRTKQPKIFADLLPFQRKAYAHLLKWYNSDLRIDKQSALQYIKSNYNRKIQNRNYWDFDEVSHSYKHPINQYNNALVGIEKISQGSYSLSIDSTGNRLHSPLTTISSKLRNYITYKGMPLVSVDIVNCQPYLLTLLFNYRFWDLSHILSLDDIGLGYTDIFSSSTLYYSLIRLCKTLENSTNSDLQIYKEKVENGVFYEYMAEYLRYDPADRKKLKPAVFQVLFTDNRFIGQDEAEPKRLFRKVFPDMYNLISIIKRKSKISLPMLLQRIESYLILKIITKAIAEQRPELPIFTIHDSIVTVQGEEEYVRQVMEEKLVEVFGLAPKFSTTYWGEPQLDFNNGNIY